MRNIVQRLRDGLEAGAVDMADIMDAADEIARLRITAAEREAVECAANQLDNSGWSSAALRALLARLA